MPSKPPTSVADISLPVHFSSVPPAGAVEPQPLVSIAMDNTGLYNQHNVSHMFGAPQSFDDMFQAAIASTLANQSFGLSANQQPQPAANQNLSILSHGSYEPIRMSAVDSFMDNQNSAFSHEHSILSNAPSDTGNFISQNAAQMQQNHSKRQSNVSNQGQRSHVQSNVMGGEQVLMSGAGKQGNFHRTLANTEVDENPSTDLMYQLRQRHLSQESQVSENGFAPLTADASLSTTGEFL